MNKINFKNNKRGFFLSIEMTIVIIVIMIIIVAVVASLNYVRNEYRAMRIIQEFRMYGDAIVNFRNLYNALPGDLNATIMNNVSEFLTSSGTNGPFLTTLKANNTGIVYGDRDVWDKKTSDAFREMAIVGLIPKGLVNISDGVNYYSATIKSQAGKTMPLSTVNSGSIYTFVNLNTSASNARMGAWITSDMMKNYWSNWQDRPLLVLSADTNTDTVGPKFGGGTSTAALSPEIAYIIDNKIDDGLPVGRSSRLTATDHRYLNSTNSTTSAAVGFGCTDAGSVTNTTIRTYTYEDTTNTVKGVYSAAMETELLNAKYQGGTSAGNKGCNMIYRVD